ncbi:unnamed protein product [Rotaria sp. Silwood1]|nr:unnamed protein product [Rotaria sp. Silwood1]
MAKMIDVDQARRAEIFKANLKAVLAHNSDPHSTFKLKINAMSDWTDEESDALRTRNMILGPMNDNQPIQSRQSKRVAVPDQYDWTNQTRVPNAVTPVMKQPHAG